MTPIQALLALGLYDVVIARRLRVSRVTVSRWRHGANEPSAIYQEAARAFALELGSALRKITDPTPQQIAA